MNNKRNIKQLIGESIGEASMCWTDIPKGIFNDTRASELVEILYKEYLLLEDRIEELEKDIYLRNK